MVPHAEREVYNPNRSDDAMLSGMGAKGSKNVREKLPEMVVRRCGFP
jgi:hypothetical protein